MGSAIKHGKCVQAHDSRCRGETKASFGEQNVSSVITLDGRFRERASRFLSFSYSLPCQRKACEMSTTVNVHDEKKRNNETDNQHCLSGLKYLLCLSIGLFVEQKCNIVNYYLFVCVSHCVYNQKYKLINYLSVSPPVFPSLTL